MNFNKDQKRAINHINGPLLVIAGPGSGKTATMIERLAHMINDINIKPERILVITFSKAAATEMKNRFIKRIGTTSYKVTFGTFHSIFLRMIKCYYKDFRYNLIDEKLKRQFLKEILKSIGFEFVINAFFDELLRDIGLFKNSDIKLSSYKPFSCEKEMFVNIYKTYQEKLVKSKNIDFDDILLIMHRCLREDKNFRIYWQNHFDYILIDEFQDINTVQFNSIKILAHIRNIFAVGDEDQSIYAFRGSNPDIMLNFTEIYDDAETIYLSLNYRSGSAIVEAGNSLIRNNKNRYNKRIVSAIEVDASVILRSYKTADDQLMGIVSIIDSCKNKSIAILCRTNSLKNYYQISINNKNVKIMTMHESKGLEFDTVILPDLSDEICPYKHKLFGYSIEEERRLFYVAITRAKTNLYISYCRRGKKKRLKKSRFIKELKH